MTLLVTGDTPLIRSETLHALVSLVNEQTFALLTCVVEDVTGYGRIVRNAAGEVVKIVEHKDALAANDPRRARHSRDEHRHHGGTDGVCCAGHLRD